MLGTLPALLSAATDTDIFSCGNNNQTTASAGSTVPLGGPYVPVADYAVELNTGLLVYKECVLRILIDQKRKALTSDFDNKALIQFNGGRTDPTDSTQTKPYYSEELGLELRNLSHSQRLRQLEGNSMQGLNASIRGAVKNAIGVSYTNSYLATEALKCPYTGDLQQAYNGAPDNFWTGFSALTDYPMCNVMAATRYTQTMLDNQIAYELNKETTKLNWGQGVYPVETIDAEGTRRTQTPGAVVLANGILHSQSGYEQLRNADDIGELINSLYAGVTNQIISGGMRAMTSGVNSYMQQVVTQTAGDFIQTSSNIAIGIITNALNIERSYKAIYTEITTFLSSKKTLIRTAETNCFSIIKSAICEPSTITATGCTAVGGGALSFTTTTGFSSALIASANIAGLEGAATTNLNKSISNITSMESLIQSVASNPSSANQATALTQLAALPPHTGQNVTTAQTQRDSISSTVNLSVDSAIEKWGNDLNPEVGWCNANNQTVKDRWKACWSGTPSECITP